MTVFGVVLHPAKRLVAPIVVAAGVHATVVLRPIWDVVGLVDRQGIHIRPQSDRGTIAGSKNADHASLADVAVNLAAELGKLASDKLRRAVLLEAKLGVCVQVLPPGGHFAVKQIDEVWDLHGEQLLRQAYKFHAPTLGDAQK